MTSEANSILTAALALPPADRVMVAEKLLDSVSDSEQVEIDAAWAEEAQRRLKGFDDGTVKATPAAEVFRAIALRKKR